jgi:hypothetical protein
VPEKLANAAVTPKPQIAMKAAEIHFSTLFTPFYVQKLTSVLAKEIPEIGRESFDCSGAKIVGI